MPIVQRKVNADADKGSVIEIDVAATVGREELRLAVDREGAIVNDAVPP